MTQADTNPRLSSFIPWLSQDRHNRCVIVSAGHFPPQPITSRGELVLLHWTTGCLLQISQPAIYYTLAAMNLTYLGKVYETYGMAAQMAQMLEKELALLILIPSMTAKGTPTPELMSSTIADLDTLPLGRLKGKLKNYATLGDSFSKLLDEANVERKFLTHHFFDHYQDVIDTEAGQKEMIQRLEKIRDLLHDSYLRVSKASLDSFTTLWGIPKEKVQEDIKSIEAQKNKNS